MKKTIVLTKLLFRCYQERSSHQTYAILYQKSKPRTAQAKLRFDQIGASVMFQKEQIVSIMRKDTFVKIFIRIAEPKTNPKYTLRLENRYFRKFKKNVSRYKSP